MNVKKLKKGDLIWYFGKLMYFEGINISGEYEFSIPSATSKTGYKQKELDTFELARYGSF
jgi:hypothetical protein